MRRREPARCGRERGFTLVELIAAVCIACTLGAIFTVVMGRLRRSVQPTISDRLVINIEATRASGMLMDRVRESLEIVRPTLGETTPFLVLRNALNEISMLYLEPDEKNSELCKKPLYRLKYFVRDGTPTGVSEAMFESVSRLTFTCTSPNQVQFNLVLGNLKGEFGLVTQVGMMSFGEVE